MSSTDRYMIIAIIETPDTELSISETHNKHGQRVGFKLV